MAMEMINTFMDSIIRGTLAGFCLSFYILAIAAVWKWFLGIMKRILLYLFPGIKARADKKGKKKNAHGNSNDTGQAGGLDHRDQLCQPMRSLHRTHHH